MAQQNRFIIRNELSKALTLNVEPEGGFFPLGDGEEVFVIDRFTAAPVSVILTHSDKGETIVSIWPGDGNVRVEKDGTDLLDLIQERVLV